MNSAQIINFLSSENLLKIEIQQLRHQLLEVQSQLSQLLRQPIEEYVMVYNSGVYQRISIDEIIHIQSDSNYSTFYLDDGSKILTAKTLKYWEIELNHTDLVRIHKSYLINKNKIESINVENSVIVLKGNITARYSRMSKSELMNKLTN